ncbi:S-adenosylmethionine-dependent methyltransferase [Gnomoniopsis sp. IMI 355080]|nr:S-adenosylmethionine-dependent methyltransferase [Gnomoniopsis sp. IMI 355080]
MARPKQKAPNPISAAVQEWLDQFRNELDAAATVTTNAETLIAEAPKRWVTYEPMVLLPSGSFTSASWTQIWSRTSTYSRDELWRKILRNIGEKSSEKTTHLAANDGIPLTLASGSSSSLQEDQENILRSPIGLRTLYGDFGPSEINGHSVSDEDFARAFWASTKQNGIYQTWAPRWTMFSRGNVKEKARLLAFHEQQKHPMGDKLSHRTLPRSAHSSAWAVDLYGGIGYFVFSYAKLGMRILCWELNAWSVEGLRRGARANGWSVKVVKGDELKRPTPELVADEDRIVVFLENNDQAMRRVKELRSHGFELPVTHVNCGLLPRSDDSWQAARNILGDTGDGWLHLHENVAMKDIEARRAEIQGAFDDWDERDGAGRAANVEHVELVKTFAPDVWHCVFDVYITKSRSINAPR